MKTKKIGGRAGLVLKKSLKSVRMKAMKTFYDVQQFLKQFGIIVYMGKRLYGELYWRWRHGWGITTFVFVVRLRLWIMQNLKPWFGKGNWLMSVNQQNFTENISSELAIFLQISWSQALQPFARINLSFSTKTNVDNEWPMQHFIWKNKVSLRFISFLMDWILGKGKSKLRNKKMSLDVSKLIF